MFTDPGYPKQIFSRVGSIVFSNFEMGYTFKFSFVMNILILYLRYQLSVNRKYTIMLNLNKRNVINKIIRHSVALKLHSHS